MILLVDSGNTRLKWRLCEESGAPLAEGADLEAFSLYLSRHKATLRGPERVAVSMVGSEVATEQLDKRLRELSSAPVHFHWPQTCSEGLKNSYSDVSRMGADRWHAMVAAWKEFQNGLVVVDAGSALTVDYIDRQGQHLGGFILPGMGMIRQSLLQNTARVGFDPKEPVDIRPANCTSDAVNHGLDWLITSLVERIGADCQRYGIDTRVLTGGDASRWQAAGFAAELRPGLVLDGLFFADRQEAVIR
ncbi:MAG: type III pantothenate kinase [Alteromonadaceae bacterium]|nr:type III pantothenate kinase [Alteromonadaceae bacterium]